MCRVWHAVMREVCAVHGMRSRARAVFVVAVLLLLCRIHGYLTRVFHPPKKKSLQGDGGDDGPVLKVSEASRVVLGGWSGRELLAQCDDLPEVYGRGRGAQRPKPAHTREFIFFD